MTDLSDFGIEHDEEGRLVGFQAGKAAALLDWEHGRVWKQTAIMVHRLRRHKDCRAAWGKLQDLKRRLALLPRCAQCRHPALPSEAFCSDVCRDRASVVRIPRAPRLLPNGIVRHKLQRGESRVIRAIRSGEYSNAYAVAVALFGRGPSAGKRRGVYHVVRKFLRCGFIEHRDGALRETQRAATLTLSEAA